MWDSDNEDLQEIMQEACHDARKSPLFLILFEAHCLC